MAPHGRTAQVRQAYRRASQGEGESGTIPELQDTLEQHAVDYFVAVDSVDATNEETEREIEKLRKRAATQTQKARNTADQIIGRMIDAGASATEVAARLGLSVREVKKANKPGPAPAPVDENDSATQSGDTHQLESVTTTASSDGR